MPCAARACRSPSATGSTRCARRPRSTCCPAGSCMRRSPQRWSSPPVTAPPSTRCSTSYFPPRGGACRRGHRRPAEDRDVGDFLAELVDRLLDGDDAAHAPAWPTRPSRPSAVSRGATGRPSTSPTACSATSTSTGILRRALMQAGAAGRPADAAAAHRRARAAAAPLPRGDRSRDPPAHGASAAAPRTSRASSSARCPRTSTSSTSPPTSRPRCGARSSRSRAGWPPGWPSSASARGEVGWTCGARCAARWPPAACPSSPRGGRARSRGPTCC